MVETNLEEDESMAGKALTRRKSNATTLRNLGTMRMSVGKEITTTK